LSVIIALSTGCRQPGLKRTERGVAEMGKAAVLTVGAIYAPTMTKDHAVVGTCGYADIVSRGGQSARAKIHGKQEKYQV
jgi:hypothetical protein